MNISKISSFYPSFGRVRRSAVEQAIKIADGDISKLSGIEEIIEEQKDNYMYDIEGLYYDPNYNYVVVSREGDETKSCKTLKQASDIATRYYLNDYCDEARIKQNEHEAEMFQIKALDLLDKCEK